MSQHTFSLGQTVITRSLGQMTTDNLQLRAFVNYALIRHKKCDWGDLSTHDKECNDLAAELLDGRRIISSYNIPKAIQEMIPDLYDDKIWIITYPGHNTTILLPCEY